ncbi:hypothetical protein LTR28_003339 [Elasticomyces elasticus]|nr:hypothetical protein LTR28_003339 [Elasticomyces elasticus]
MEDLGSEEYDRNADDQHYGSSSSLRQILIHAQIYLKTAPIVSNTSAKTHDGQIRPLIKPNPDVSFLRSCGLIEISASSSPVAEYQPQDSSQKEAALKRSRPWICQEGLVNGRITMAM